jgi:hypothetical protein
MKRDNLLIIYIYWLLFSLNLKLKENLMHLNFIDWVLIIHNRNVEMEHQ